MPEENRVNELQTIDLSSHALTMNEPHLYADQVRFQTVDVPKDRYWLHIGLFLLTLLTTVFAGGQMAGRTAYYEVSGITFSILGLSLNSAFLLDGLRFGASLLLFLSVHEFGHYFAARRHGIRTSLPYFIPFPFNGIGTFGAVIRIREKIPSMTKLFDIGAAGPVAGFVAAVAVLLFGLITLPSLDYVQDLGEHESLQSHIENYGQFPTEVPSSPSSETTAILVVGTTPLYWFLTQFFDDVPPMWEMYHYPFLFAGWLGLFFTAVNLLPVGQLDGGHMLYALVGPRWHRRFARIFVVLLLISGGVGFMSDAGPLIAETFSRWVSRPGLNSEIAPWLVLSAIILFYVKRIFSNETGLVVAVLFGVLGAIAALSWSTQTVASIGYSGWLFWCLLIVVMIRVEHPEVEEMEPLNPARKALAILGLVIFALCFSIKPLYFA